MDFVYTMLNTVWVLTTSPGPLLENVGDPNSTFVPCLKETLCEFVSPRPVPFPLKQNTKNKYEYSIPQCLQLKWIYTIINLKVLYQSYI